MKDISVGYSAPMIIGIMAFSVVSFLFLIDTAINPDGSKKTTNTSIVNKNTNEVACQTDAKLCPDGSAVGRSGPNCEFTDCPTTNTNTATNENTNTTITPRDGWKIYTNSLYNISFQYPESFGVFATTDDATGFRGKNVATSTSAEGVINLSVLEKTYDPDNIVGLYGTVETQNLKSVDFGAQAGSMFFQGDAGCGAQEAVTGLSATQTLWVSFTDCVDDINATEELLYDDVEQIQSILATFVFTD